MTPTERLIREPERKHLTGVTRGTWYELEKKGLAPKAIPLSLHTKGYRHSEIIEWINERIEQAVA